MADDMKIGPVKAENNEPAGAAKVINPTEVSNRFEGVVDDDDDQDVWEMGCEDFHWQA